MDNALFANFAPVVDSLTEAEIVQETKRPYRLLLDRSVFNGRQVEIAYAPFDHVNQAAKIVIVGLTPGRQQMRNALLEARRVLRSGSSQEAAAKAAKVFASFSGPMRSNLIAMLDSLGVQRLLGLQSTATLWNDDARLAHFTSVLRYPVFVEGENYSGAPSILSTPLLCAHLLRWFGAEMMALPSAIYVPLGPKAVEAVNAVAQQLGLDRDRVLSGLPHPSGANAERIAFFLGRKTREALSRKVEPIRLTAARASIEAKVAKMIQANAGDAETGYNPLTPTPSSGRGAAP